MSSLTNKRILLGVTGGIAAYKSADLIRRLKDAGASVRVVMTKGAQQFITPLTMQALSGQPVHTELLDTKAEAAMGHIELARWADAVLVAPASADFIGRLVRGEGSDLLSTLCLATRAKIALAPAMNQAMWLNDAVQQNIVVAKQRLIDVWGPAEGSQACGEVGPGRMLEPAELVERTSLLFQSTELSGKKIVITAGPTREAIDPVRYISNHSSGKMGYALAAAAAEAGGHTILVSGPTNLPAPERVSVIQVNSAHEMYEAVMAEVTDADLFIGAAAVADYRPAETRSTKIKKSENPGVSIEMLRNPDIIASVAAEHGGRMTVVGFAAETDHVEEYARKKLVDKKLDMVIANDVSVADIGFNSDYNAVSIVEAGSTVRIEETSKSQLARELLRLIAKKIKKKQ